MTHKMLAGIAVLKLAQGLTGCAGTGSSPGPTAPSASSAPATPPANNPVAQPTGLQPTITIVSPNVVSTAGPWGTITGTQFQPGATAKIGSTAVWVMFQDSTTLRFANSGAHAAGSVDVTVTNPGGFAATLPRGYAYALADSFDANGEWIEDLATTQRYMHLSPAAIEGAIRLLDMAADCSSWGESGEAGSTEMANSSQ